MEALSVDNIVDAYLKAYTNGLERGSDTDWSFRECEIHNKAHKLLDQRLEQALAVARAKEAADCEGQDKGCAGCSK